MTKAALGVCSDDESLLLHAKYLISMYYCGEHEERASCEQSAGFRAPLHIFRRSDGHGKPPTMHRTTLQIYHSEKSLSFQIEALQWVLEGWILLLDSGSTSHAVQQ